MNKKVEIIPAILPKTFQELEDAVVSIQGLVKTVQVDICDGKLTPKATWPYRKTDDTFNEIIREERGLPGWEKLDYEFDLMVSNPFEVVDDWISAGATRIVLHIESDDVEKTVRKSINRVEIGLALNIETPIETIQAFSEDIDFIQCMGIDHVGLQGQEFDDKVIGKVKAIRAKYPDIVISVDGGVSTENAGQLVLAGADRLVIGSAIFDSDNPIESLEQFKSLYH